MASLPGGSAEADNDAVIDHATVNAVMEATFTNPNDGEPAISHCRRALSQGKHVITTNKGAIALYLSELLELAEADNVSIEYEGTVISGTPIISLAKRTLKGSTLKSVRGIMNGTANFMLGQIEKGASYEEAMRGGQDLGYAEADPVADVEGFDVMLKVVILANSLMGVDLKTNQVVRSGITGLTEKQIRDAAKSGSHWKLIGQVSADANGSVSAQVSPVLLDETDPLSGISGPTNAVSFDTDLLGEVMISGPGAGRMETAYALLSDLLAIHSKLT